MRRVIIVQGHGDDSIVAIDGQIERDDIFAAASPDDLRIRNTHPGEAAPEVVERSGRVIECDGHDGVRPRRKGDRRTIGDRRCRVGTVRQILVVDHERYRIAGRGAETVRDGDRLRCPIEIVVAIRQRVGERGIDRAIGLIETRCGVEGPVARGVERVDTGIRRHGRDPGGSDDIVGAADRDRGNACTVCALDIVCQDIAREAGVGALDDRQGSLVDGIGNVIDDIDRDRTRSDKIAGRIVDFVAEAIRPVHDIARIFASVAVAERCRESIAIGTRIAVERERAVGSIGRAGEHIDEWTGGIGYDDLPACRLTSRSRIAARRKTGFVGCQIGIIDCAFDICDIDRERCGGRVTVPVDDRIREDVDRVGIGRIRRSDIGVDAGRCIEREGTVLTDEHEVAVDQSNRICLLVFARQGHDAAETVGPRDVVRAVGQNISADGATLVGGRDIVVSGRRIVVEDDGERGCDLVPVAVRDEERNDRGRIHRFGIRPAFVQDVIDQRHAIGAGGVVQQLDREQHAARTGSGQHIAGDGIRNGFGTDYRGAAIQ